MINTKIVSGEKAEQADTSSSSITAKKKINKSLIIVVGIIIAVLIIGIIVITSFDKHNRKKGDEAIQAVQDSYFEFLSEMTVGDLLNEYYVDENWLYDSSAKQVEFNGTNKNDNSGLALHFSSVRSDNTVDVTYIKYHEESEAAHNISKEEFEKYIISLYAQLDDNFVDEDIQTTTEKVTTTKNVITETITTTTETTTTTVAEKNTGMEISSDYLTYLTLLDYLNMEIQSEYGSNTLTYHYYYLYDINHDGIYELLTHLGEAEADATISIYSLDENGNIKDLVEIEGGHTWITEKDGKLYSNFGYHGYQIVNEIYMGEDLGSWIIALKKIFEEDGLSDYTNYGTAIKGYDISDTSAVKALCPKELLENRPYITAHAETYSLPKFGDSEVHLYADGNFDYIKVQAFSEVYDDYEFSMKTYTKAECEDYIVLNINGLAIPSAYLVIVPYDESDVAGDIIICDIPQEASGTAEYSDTSTVINMKGQINCHGETVAGYTTDYVVNGGAVGKVRNSLGDT